MALPHKHVARAQATDSWLAYLHMQIKTKSSSSPRNHPEPTGPHNPHLPKRVRKSKPAHAPACKSSVLFPCPVEIFPVKVRPVRSRTKLEPRAFFVCGRTFTVL